MRSSLRPAGTLAVLASTVMLTTPQPSAAAAAPTVTLDLRVARACPSPHCDVEVDVFVCSATFTPGSDPTDVPYTTAVECYAPTANGAAPGMALTVTPGPRATSGGYANGPWGVTICVAGKSSYLYRGSTTTLVTRAGPICKSSLEWPPL